VQRKSGSAAIKKRDSKNTAAIADSAAVVKRWPLDLAAESFMQLSQNACFLPIHVASIRDHSGSVRTRAMIAARM
jgi:hypothetical protein